VFPPLIGKKFVKFTGPLAGPRISWLDPLVNVTHGYPLNPFDEYPGGFEPTVVKFQPLLDLSLQVLIVVDVANVSELVSAASNHS
jgi:hypothetical protein